MFEALSIIRFTDKWKYQYGKGRHQTKVGMKGCFIDVNTLEVKIIIAITNFNLTTLVINL
jgi:hypothetical protein